jgi:hypothetical protein
VGDTAESYVGDDDGVPRLSAPVTLSGEQVTLALPTGFSGQGLRLWRTGDGDMRFRFRAWIKGNSTGEFIDGATADASSDDAALDPETAPIRLGTERLLATIRCVLIANELLKRGGFAQADKALELAEPTDVIVKAWNLRVITITGSYPYLIQSLTRQPAVPGL